jgi:hypothetical protein
VHRIIPGLPGLPQRAGSPPAPAAAAGRTDHLAGLRPHLDPALWQARYGPRLGQLQQILGCYTDAERERARSAITSQQRAFIADIVSGHWDLR